MTEGESGRMDELGSGGGGGFQVDAVGDGRGEEGGSGVEEEEEGGCEEEEGVRAG